MTPDQSPDALDVLDVLERLAREAVAPYFRVTQSSGCGEREDHDSIMVYHNAVRDPKDILALLASHRQALARLRAAEGVVEAARAFRAQVNAAVSSSSWQTFESLGASHGYEYTGPNFSMEEIDLSRAMQEYDHQQATPGRGGEAVWATTRQTRTTRASTCRPR